MVNPHPTESKQSFGAGVIRQYTGVMAPSSFLSQLLSVTGRVRMDDIAWPVHVTHMIDSL